MWPNALNNFSSMFPATPVASNPQLLQMLLALIGHGMTAQPGQGQNPGAGMGMQSGVPIHFEPRLLPVGQPMPPASQPTAFPGGTLPTQAPMSVPPPWGGTPNSNFPSSNQNLVKALGMAGGRY